MLRGAFGLTLRRLTCHDPRLDCRDCALRKTCPYPAVFDPGTPAAEAVLKRFADPPRPFVVRAAEQAQRCVRAGDLFPLDVHVVGRAAAHSPYLLATLARLADDGIGPRRTRMELERVDALNATGEPCGVALDSAPATMRPSAGVEIRASHLLRPGDREARVIRTRFVTPTFLKEGGAAVEAPSFGTLIRRLRARLGALATLFGEGPFDSDPREQGALADGVEARSAEVEWRRESRRSTRTGERHPLEGIAGEVVYAGEIGPFLPLLRLGELLHVGKHASFGLGRFEIVVLG